MEIPVLLAAFGSLRRSEICALDMEHIKGNTVHVEYGMALTEKREWIKKRPKSFAGDRYIEMPSFVINKIKASNLTGNITTLPPDGITKSFRKITKKLGMDACRFHDLRHYNASILHALGVPEAQIMKRGGWENSATLKNVYRHVLEEKENEENKKIIKYFEEKYDTKYDKEI